MVKNSRMLWAGLIVIILIAMYGGADFLTGSMVPYKSGWEARSAIAAVNVPTKGTCWAEGPLPAGWEVLGPRGYTQISADPDGVYKPYHGYPNIEVEVGGIDQPWWHGSLSDWTKRIIRSDEVIVVDSGVETGYRYVVEEYTFHVRLSVTADIQHLMDMFSQNDYFKTETPYHFSKSLQGTEALITIYPTFEIDPWKIRENHSIGAWIMKASLVDVENFADEVEKEKGSHNAGHEGTASMLTATGPINMFTTVKGHRLDPITFQPGVTPDPDLRTAVYMELSANMIPGYYWDGWFADDGTLHDIPRDIIMEIAVEVLRTDNWEIETSRQEGGKDDKPERDEGSFDWANLQWDLMSPSQQMMVIGIVAVGALLLLSYVGLMPVLISMLMSRK